MNLSMENQTPSSRKPLLAVDIGGTKVAAAVVTQDGKVLAQDHEPTCQTGPSDGTAQIIRLCEGLIRAGGLTPGDFEGIGVGIPAMLEQETDFIIRGPNLNGWRNVALRPALEAHFHLPVCIEYDGHCAVLGEWWMGAGRGFRSLVDVIIGTGVGGGMVLEGHLIRGMNRLAGAVGWFSFSNEAGHDNERERSLGYWEARTAGPGIARRAKALLASQFISGSLLENSPEEITAREVFAAARQGDRLALTVTDEVSVQLGLGIANIVSMVNPEIIILGGSVGSHAGFLVPQITRVVNRWAQPVSAQAVQIIPSTLNGEASLLGAAYGMMLRLKG